MLGLAGLCLVAWMTDYSMILMLKCGTIANTSSYQDLMAAAFGRVGFAILSVLQFMFPFVREYVYWVYLSICTLLNVYFCEQLSYAGHLNYKLVTDIISPLVQK